jgi:hypothetical protein
MPLLLFRGRYLLKVTVLPVWRSLTSNGSTCQNMLPVAKIITLLLRHYTEPYLFPPSDEVEYSPLPFWYLFDIKAVDLKMNAYITLLMWRTRYCFGQGSATDGSPFLFVRSIYECSSCDPRQEAGGRMRCSNTKRSSNPDLENQSLGLSFIHSNA